MCVYIYTQICKHKKTINNRKKNRMVDVMISHDDGFPSFRNEMYSRFSFSSFPHIENKKKQLLSLLPSSSSTKLSCNNNNNSNSSSSSSSHACGCEVNSLFESELHLAAAAGVGMGMGMGRGVGSGKRCFKPNPFSEFMLNSIKLSRSSTEPKNV